MRIGHGFDAHRFGDGDHVVIGGIRIDHSRGRWRILTVMSCYTPRRCTDWCGWLGRHR